jgi:hypothetical protein
MADNNGASSKTATLEAEPEPQKNTKKRKGRKGRRALENRNWKDSWRSRKSGVPEGFAGKVSPHPTGL